ncbi:MAG: DMT family transporter [Sediminicola sp.]
MIGNELKSAMVYMLICTLSLSGMNSLIKYLGHFNVYELVFFRALGSLVFTMSYLLQQRIPLWGNKRKLLFLRGIVGLVSMALFFMSLQYLPMGTAVSLRYMAPIFAAIFAVFLLKEKISPPQWFYFFMSFAGVLVLKGMDVQMDTTGLLFVMGAAISSGLVYILIGKIGNADHPVVVVNYFMAIATLVGGLMAVPHWVMPEGVEWFLLAGLGIFGFVGQLFMTKAFQVASTNVVAPLNYMEVLFTGLVGIIGFGELYTHWTLLGIGLIVGGLVLNVLYRSKQRLK